MTGKLVNEQQLSPGTRSRFMEFYENVFAVYYEQVLREGDEDFPFEAVAELYGRWKE